MTNSILALDAALLDTVTGGAALDIKASGSPAGTIDAQLSTGSLPDPDKQLRCYEQVRSQRNWFQSSAETLRQQVDLCGRLR